MRTSALLLLQLAALAAADRPLRTGPVALNVRSTSLKGRGAALEPLPVAATESLRGGGSGAAELQAQAEMRGAVIKTVRSCRVAFLGARAKGGRSFVGERRGGTCARPVLEGRAVSVIVVTRCGLWFVRS